MDSGNIILLTQLNKQTIMALTFSSKVEQIEVIETFNSLTLLYRFSLRDGVLEGSIQGEAKAADGRQTLNMHTSDGINFYNNCSVNATDDLACLDKLRTDLIELFNDPVSYSA